MFCKKCGKEIQDDVRFCTQCGAPINLDAEATQEAVPNEDSQQADSSTMNVSTDPQGSSQQGIVCPACGSSDLAIERFTWWGGMLGAALANRLSCKACGHKFKIKR